MKRPEALVVDDDAGVRIALRAGLEEAGLSVREARDGQAGMAAVRSSPPDVAVVDVAMPRLNGVEMVRQLRTEGWEFPICILSARDEISDRVAGLAAGADDYVVKPFSIGELAARLHALVQLHRVRDGRPLEVGDLTIDVAQRSVRRGNRVIALTFREYELLLALARHPDQVLARGQLLAHVWGYTWEVDSNVVDVFVGYLRRKLESHGEARMIDTVRGVGFILRS